MFTFSDFVSEDASDSSCDEYRMNDNDLMKSNIFHKARRKTDGDVVCGGLCVFDNDERICKASSTRNCAVVNFILTRRIQSPSTGESSYGRDSRFADGRGLSWVSTQCLLHIPIEYICASLPSEYFFCRPRHSSTCFRVLPPYCRGN